MFPSFLLIYCMDGGQGIIIHEQNRIRLKPGIFYLFYPFHSFSFLPQPGEKLANLYIYFDIEPVSAKNIIKKYIADFDYTIFQKEKVSFMGPQMKAICHEVINDELETTFFVQHFVRGFLGYVLHDYTANGSGTLVSHQKNRELVDLMFDYLAAHLSEPVNISKIANHIGSSCSSLNRACQYFICQSPAQAASRYKINEAIVMMGQGYSIKTITYELGYSSPSHFSRVFKSIMGENPVSYMKKELLQ